MTCEENVNTKMLRDVARGEFELVDPICHAGFLHFLNLDAGFLAPLLPVSFIQS